MDGTSKPPQISEMFQKFALAFRTKTFELFADDGGENAAAASAADDADGFSLLDSAEEFITDQKVVVIKPDPTHNSSATNSASLIRPTSPQFLQSLITSIFATISSFEASYLQLQTAHVPFDEKAIEVADRALVSHLQRLSDARQLYRNFRKNPNLSFDIPFESCLEAQVRENQNKLRALDNMINRLQSEIDARDEEVCVLRKKLDNIQQSNSKLSKRLSKNLNSALSSDILLTIRVFDSMLRDAIRSLHRFTKLLIGLMKKAGWDLELAANSVYSDVNYANKGHYQYAFLSYVCLGMFRGFDLRTFNSDGGEVSSNGDELSQCKNNSLKQLIEHVSVNPMDILSMDPSCDFSKFCERKYEQLIHPTMESSVFSNLDRKDVVVGSWRSLSVFYESFVQMASSIWLLHKLAYSFDPVVDIFQVERDVDFSIVYMEDATKRGFLPGKSRPRVAFTVVPGFRIGSTVIQSRVYLTSLKSTE